MAVLQEHVTRRQVGLSPVGKPVMETSRHGHPALPGSVEEWAQQAIARLGYDGRRSPAGRAVVALLEAGDGADARKVGRDLDGYQRYAVLRTLQAITEPAPPSSWCGCAAYRPGIALARRLHTAWKAAWGDQPPGAGQAQVRVLR